MAITATIQELLQGIMDSQYGRDMRQFIHDAIQKCYEEGSAGETDLVARQAIEEVQNNFIALNEWYSLPMTRGSSVTGASAHIGENLIINPALKLMQLKFEVGLRGTSYSGGFGTILKELPILPYFKNISSQAGKISSYSQRVIPLIVTGGSPNLNNLRCSIWNTDESEDFKADTATQSIVTLYGNFPDNADVSAYVVLPYKELCAAHPFSQATLITS